MSRAGDFLPAARGRLLPLALPLRFFGAAVFFHLAGWLALLPAAELWLRAPSAPGWPLAALHCFTLGVLVMTALGAAAQLLPVATRQAAPPARWLAAVWWLFAPGVALLVAGMVHMQPLLLATGAGAALLALLLWAVLVARNLAGARGMPGVVLHGWLALVSLGLLLLAAAMLIVRWLPGTAPAAATASASPAWLELHRFAGPWGLMGMLALGVSYILVPMFALGDVPAQRLQLRSGAAAALALSLAAAAAGSALRGLAAAAAAAGAVAVLLHLRAMRATLAGGMRRQLGPSFALVRLGWLGLLASLGLAGALAAGASWPRAPAALGLLLIGVWLLSFLFGLLQRIVPFLAAMHGGPGRRNPTPGALTHEGALRLHFGCHLAALALLAAAVVLDQPHLVRAGAASGALGAAAFAHFFVQVVRRRARAA